MTDLRISEATPLGAALAADELPISRTAGVLGGKITVGAIVALAAGISGVSQENSGRALAEADNGAVLHCTGTITFTVPAGLPASFSVIFAVASGTVAVTAGAGAAVQDVRVAGVTAPNTCVLIPVNTDSYFLSGCKA